MQCQGAGSTLARHYPNLAGETTGASVFLLAGMVECLKPCSDCAAAITEQRLRLTALTPGRLGVPRDTPTCMGSQREPALRWSHGPGPTRILQLQKELIRTEGAEGSGSEGGSARGGWLSRDHRGGRGGDSPPTTRGVGGVTLRVGWCAPPPRQPYQDNDCYCVPAVDPAQTAPSCSSCRASGPL